jgi:UDP-N-acetylmuramoyl-tripeptide--D-alanyl-D-alanine ligase
MIAMRLSEAAGVLGGFLRGDDVGFRGCSTDTRSLERGALFVALRGERFDGHDFLGHAMTGGAAAALVERIGGSELPLITVPDSRRALGELGAAWRGRLDCPVVAVTGSNGKTTVKEMLAAVLGEVGPVLATRGNLNNDIGMPLTLCRLGREHRFAVLEMGANHVGEIARLAEIAVPTVGIVTQCAPAHLQGFGSIEAVARAKGELLDRLDPGGTAIINGDDVYAALWSELAGGRTRLTFGLERPADVSADFRLEAECSRVSLRTPVGEVSVTLSLPGRHNVMNALAAAAAAVSLAVPLDAVRHGLEGVRPVSGRLQVKRAMQGGRVVDDSYNANPGSLSAGLAVLQGFPGRHWLALGDMAELGPAAADLHAEAGRLAREAGVERLLATGPLSCASVEAFGSGGEHYPTWEALVAALKGELGADVTLLVKGSRCSQMDLVVNALAREA